MIVQLEMSHDIDMTTHLCTPSPFISGLHLPLVLILSNSSGPAQSKVRRRGEYNNNKNRERNKEFREEKEVKKSEKRAS